MKSPYLPEIFDVYEDGTEVAVLEEFVQGDSLAELLRGCLFNEKETRWTALDLLRGLCVLHSLGIVHRDIKPENVLLRPDGTAVLTDFDASRVSKAAQSRDTVAMGTVGFAAPEQFSITQTDARADIYSMGILINAMLTGEHPSSEIARGTLRKIVLKCTMIAPEKRFQSAKDLMEALE